MVVPIEFVIEAVEEEEIGVVVGGGELLVVVEERVGVIDTVLSSSQSGAMIVSLYKLLLLEKKTLHCSRLIDAREVIFVTSNIDFDDKDVTTTGVASSVEF